MLAPLRQTDNIPTVDLLIRMIKYSQAKVSFRTLYLAITLKSSLPLRPPQLLRYSLDLTKAIVVRIFVSFIGLLNLFLQLHFSLFSLILALKIEDQADHVDDNHAGDYHCHGGSHATIS